MLKHLTGIKNNNMRKKVGQIDIDLGVAPPEVNTGLDLWNSGNYTTSTVNNFDWVELIDSVGNLVTIGFDGYNNYILAQGTALQMSATTPGMLPPSSSFGIEPAGVLTPSDTQMWLTVALIGMGLIWVSRKI